LVIRCQIRVEIGKILTVSAVGIGNTGRHKSSNVPRPFLDLLSFQAGIFSILLLIFIWWYLGSENAGEQAHAERFGIFPVLRPTTFGAIDEPGGKIGIFRYKGPKA
jgi:hypothetical protein